MPSLEDEVKQILTETPITTQSALAEALRQRGHELNQSTVSRLLRRAGAVKAKNEFGNIVYRLPKEPAPPRLDTQLFNLVFDIQHNETSIIINTSPGCASMIGRLLDHQREKAELLGVIAGDDTVLAIPKSVQNIKKTLWHIKHILRLLD